MTQPTDAQSGVRKYHRRPVDVEAVQVTEENASDVALWMVEHGEDSALVRTGLGVDFVYWIDDAQSWEAWPGAYVVRDGRTFASCGAEEFAERYDDQPNPLNEVGVLRTRTDALASETAGLYRESLRLAQLCDRQEAELRRLRAVEPVALEAVFEHCEGCPGHHEPA